MIIIMAKKTWYGTGGMMPLLTLLLDIISLGREGVLLNHGTYGNSEHVAQECLLLLSRHNHMP